MIEQRERVDALPAPATVRIPPHRLSVVSLGRTRTRWRDNTCRLELYTCCHYNPPPHVTVQSNLLVLHLLVTVLILRANTSCCDITRRVKFGAL